MTILQDRKAELEKERRVLAEVEAELATTRAELQTTAAERDLHTHLVERHVETEHRLGQEARKLLVVCDETTRWADRDAMQ